MPRRSAAAKQLAAAVALFVSFATNGFNVFYQGDETDGGDAGVLHRWRVHFLVDIEIRLAAHIGFALLLLGVAVVQAEWQFTTRVSTSGQLLGAALFAKLIRNRK